MGAKRAGGMEQVDVSLNNVAFVVIVAIVVIVLIVVIVAIVVIVLTVVIIKPTRVTILPICRRC